MILRLLRALRTFPKELPPKTKGEKKMAGCVSPSSSSWKPLLRKALDSNAHLKHSVFFQLATIGANGRPSNRTVVFRGFQENGDKIQINTDVRSNKIEEIKHCPFGEICCTSPTPGQFRINGTIDFIDGSNSDPAKLQQREKAWFMSSLKSRMQYLGPAPGIPVIDEGTAKENHLDPTAGPVDAFCSWFRPRTGRASITPVDYLNLKSNERLMFRSRQSSDGGKGWMFERVNP
ncbi:Pyridoxine/pyridoxamine 5'-phosphate oxidase 2 [Ananas comosus]|uniref:pyridoxal 5'-phosphate synthase n=1 Tax=Ananas comosus TaxID=4615 RepID=A0A199V004_ANACO|nr:Pyridoxine/pyridoxamine 5'-phosphate oxidase 2 [Ananas comosus]